MRVLVATTAGAGRFGPLVPFARAFPTCRSRRVAPAGAGITVEDGQAAVEGLSEAVRRVLEDESYRVVTTRIAAEMAGLPSPSQAVPLLEVMGVDS